MHVLVVEDDKELAAQLCHSLGDSGHEATHVDNGSDGLVRAREAAFDVMIVDRMMPGLDGLSMIAELRETGITTPALILSALGQVDDRVDGLRAGGDDYLVKPYAFSELLARIEVLERRLKKSNSDNSLVVSDLTLDRIQHQANRAGVDITLQPREYRLLEYLMQNDGRMVTRSMLLQNVWDLNFDPQTNVIDVHISRLRAKIDKDFDKPLLHTIRGRGYKLGVNGGT